MCPGKTPPPAPRKLIALASDWGTVRHFHGEPFGARAPQPLEHLFTISAIGDCTLQGIPVSYGAISVGHPHVSLPGEYALEVIDLAVQPEYAAQVEEFLVQQAWKAVQALGYRKMYSRKLRVKEMIGRLKQQGDALRLPSAEKNAIDV